MQLARRDASEWQGVYMHALSHALSHPHRVPALSHPHRVAGLNLTLAQLRALLAWALRPCAACNPDLAHCEVVLLLVWKHWLHLQEVRVGASCPAVHVIRAYYTSAYYACYALIRCPAMLCTYSLPCPLTLQHQRRLDPAAPAQLHLQRAGWELARRARGRGGAALQQRLVAELGEAGAHAQMQEWGARASPWTREEDDYLMSPAGQAYMEKQKNAHDNTQKCDPPLGRHTIQQAYQHRYYLNKKAKKARGA